MFVTVTGSIRRPFLRHFGGLGFTFDVKGCPWRGFEGGLKVRSTVALFQGRGGGGGILCPKHDRTPPPPTPKLQLRFSFSAKLKIPWGHTRLIGGLIQRGRDGGY